MSLRFSQVRLQVAATPRELRRLVAAVALCQGEVIPVEVVPGDYLPLMKGVHEALASGLSWREALAEVGLTLPNEEKVLEQVGVLQNDLQRLWPQILFVTGALQRSGNPVAVDQALQKIRTLMA